MMVGQHPCGVAQASALNLQPQFSQLYDEVIVHTVPVCAVGL